MNRFEIRSNAITALAFEERLLAALGNPRSALRAVQAEARAMNAREKYRELRKSERAAMRDMYEQSQFCGDAYERAYERAEARLARFVDQRGEERPR